MRTPALSAFVALIVASPTFAQTHDPAVMTMGPHPQIVQDWRANYRFDCGELTVLVDLAVAAGKANVSAIDLGRGPIGDTLDEVNEALDGQVFSDLVVTCTRTDPYPDVMFRFYVTNADGGSEPSAVSVQAIGRQPSDARLIRR